MQGNANTQAGANQVAQRQSHGAAQYQKVFGPGKRRLRGLWKRGERFYGRLKVEDAVTGLQKVRRVMLEDKDGQPVDTVAAAVKALAALTTKRDEETLELAPKRTPIFREYAPTYFAWLDAVKEAKSKKTVQSERYFVEQWNRHFGALRLKEIREATLTKYQELRSKEGVGPRTINLEVVAVRNVLKRAVVEKLIRSVPKVPPLRFVTKRKPLLSADDLDKLCRTAIDGWPVERKGKDGKKESVLYRPRTGRQFADFVRLMAFSGGRMRETLALTWADVDFDRGQLHFGTRGGTKSRKPRTVDFNADLETHLRDIATRRQPDSDFLFPSPRRGDADFAAQSFHATLEEARKVAGIPHFTAHLCRHYFASRAVMAGIDFMTIAGWLGHADGGVLVGKVYGHLADEHRKAMAQRLTFAVKTVHAEVA